MFFFCISSTFFNKQTNLNVYTTHHTRVCEMLEKAFENKISFISYLLRHRILSSCLRQTFTRKRVLIHFHRLPCKGMQITREGLFLMHLYTSSDDISSCLQALCEIASLFRIYFLESCEYV